MAYDIALADRIRLRIGDRPDLVEKEVFGGLAMLIGGNMAVGVSGDALMVRVGKDGHDAAMARPGARVFDMTGRPMRGWIVVDPIGFNGPGELDRWVDEGVAHALTLPTKGS
jgi:hypothetical protein